MGTYEDQDLVKSHVKSLSTDGYFRIWYVYVYGEYGRFEIIVELEKLPGWEGYYSDSIYRDQLRQFEGRIRNEVVYNLGFHQPRIRLQLRD